MTDSNSRPMGGHDIRRSDRITAWATRLIMAVKDDDYQAAWSVLNETNDDPATLRNIAVLVAGLAAERMSPGHTEQLTAAMVDKLAAPPVGRWYPGDPEGDPNNPSPPHR